MPFDVDWVRSQLPGHRVDWHPSLGSTMTEAIRLASQGCGSGAIVGADQQTAGQGRLGRTWHSEPGLGLYVSIVLRPSFSTKALPVATLALGLATVEAILKATALACDLRWPNDVLIHGKKCAGILAQLEGTALIAGIGINVNHEQFPSDLRDLATSLYLAGGLMQSRERLLVELVSSVESFCGLLQTEGPEPILRMFSHASSFVYGRRVRVDLGDSLLKGTTAGLNESGFLLLREDSGKENIIIAGGVRPCS